MEQEGFSTRFADLKIGDDSIPGAIPPRPGYNTTGRPVNLAVNFHIAKALPSKPVHQYDVSQTSLIILFYVSFSHVC